MNRRRLRRIVTVLLLVAGVISLAIWSVLPASIPVRGRFHDFELDTTVDSESAKYYIESYTQGRADKPQLHQAIEKLKRDFEDRIPNHLELHRLAQTYSRFCRVVLRGSAPLSQWKRCRQQALQDEFGRVLREGSVVVDSDGLVIVLVPGYDYEENGHVTGADLKAQYSVDFAALFFADQLLSLNGNAAVNRRFRMNLDRVLREGSVVVDFRRPRNRSCSRIRLRRERSRDGGRS